MGHVTTEYHFRADAAYTLRSCAGITHHRGINIGKITGASGHRYII